MSRHDATHGLLAACRPAQGGMYASGYCRALRDVSGALQTLQLGLTAQELSAGLERQATHIRRALRGEEATR